MPDIRVIMQPEGGKCHIVGDIHGRLDLFLDFLETIDEQDQVILVGDLIDRGPDSLKLIKKIVDLNQQRKAKGLPLIEAVRGNHEQLFLDYYANRDQLKDNPDALIFSEGIGGQWVKDLDEDELKFLADYFSTLPYMLHVEGPEPFDVVHATRPISAEELAARLSAGIHSLTAEERQSAIWDRPSNEGVYSLESILAYRVYVGHSIYGGLRRDTNHINLDVGGYLYDILCVVTHETNTCTLIGDPEKHSPEMLAIVSELIEHFDFIALMKGILKVIDTPGLKDKFQKIDALLEWHVNQYCQRYNLTAVEYCHYFIKSFVLPVMDAEMAQEFQNYLKTKEVPPKPSSKPLTFNQIVCGWEKNEKLSPEERAKLIHRTLHDTITEDHGKAVDEPSGTLSYNRDYLKLLKDNQRLFSKQTKIALGRHLLQLLKPSRSVGLFSRGLPPFVSSVLIILDLSGADIKAPEKPEAPAPERKEIKEVKEEKKEVRTPRLT